MRPSSTNSSLRQRQVARSRLTPNFCSKKSSADLPLGRFYPELKDCMLLCATEMSKRSDMDTVAAALARMRNDQESLRSILFKNEPLLFEQSSPGKARLSTCLISMCPRSIAEEVAGQRKRPRRNRRFPGSQRSSKRIRHFTRLSTWNYAIDLGLYPLGSCTMKYNPRVNELVARTEGLAWAHPYQPEELSQGCMEVIAALENALAEITGMDAVTLQPAAGAHGEFTGILMIRALLETARQCAQEDPGA